MVDDIKSVNPKDKLLGKFADGMTVSVPMKSTGNSATADVNNIDNWAKNNRMWLNFSKTWEMVICVKTSKALPPRIGEIERKECLKRLGMTFQEDPKCWDLHVENLLSKARSRMYILRVTVKLGLS